MPNHCDQQVHIHGPRALVLEIYHRLNNAEPRFCDVIKPMPFEIYAEPSADSCPSWYNWSVENWGTKWDVADVQITDPIKIEDDKAYFTFNCWTAWGPPIPIWEKLHSLGVSVDADYQDEGDMFEGTWLNGSGKTWQPEYEEDENGDVVKILREDA